MVTYALGAYFVPFLPPYFYSLASPLPKVLMLVPPLCRKNDSQKLWGRQAGRQRHQAQMTIVLWYLVNWRPNPWCQSTYVLAS